MKIRYVILIVIFMALSGVLAADEIKLKNGRALDGIIEKEYKDSVELNIGSGIIALPRNIIVSIKRSSEKEREEFLSKFSKRSEESEKRRPEFDAQREERFRAHEEWVRASASQKKEPEEAGVVQAARDADHGSILVNTVLNGNVKATLILDTGASLIVLSRKIGDKLGVDFTSTKNDIMTLSLAGGKRVEAKGIVLNTVSLDGVSRKKVSAAVLLEDIVDVGIKDGLLGMSFLKFYNVKVDQKTMKLTFENLN